MFKFQSKDIILILISVLILYLSLFFISVNAETIYVTTEEDEFLTSPGCSLDEAVFIANGQLALLSGTEENQIRTECSYLAEFPDIGYTIRFDRSLDGIPINITDNTPGNINAGPINLFGSDIKIEGNGVENTILQGRGFVLDGFRILNNSGRNYIKNLTIKDGYANGENGGGIYSSYSINLENVVLESNIAENGGGLYAEIEIDITDMKIRNNFANKGAGVYLKTSMLSASPFKNSEVHNNGILRADISSNGGGIYLESGTLNLIETRIYNNLSLNGAGIYSRGFLLLKRSEVSTNGSFSTEFGGGIYNKESNLDIINSTISNNESRIAAAIYSTGQSIVSINSSTIAENGDDLQIGLVFDHIPDLVNSINISFKNSIISNNGFQNCSIIYPRLGDYADDLPLGLPYKATYKSYGHNFVWLDSRLSHGWGDVSCRIYQSLTNGDTTLINPMLLTLRDNGGPTHTMALSESSPAINYISKIDCTSQVLGVALLEKDQRGFRRAFGPLGRCDAGAYEKAAIVELEIEPRVVRIPTIPGRIGSGFVTLSNNSDQWISFQNFGFEEKVNGFDIKESECFESLRLKAGDSCEIKFSYYGEEEGFYPNVFTIKAKKEKGEEFEIVLFSIGEVVINSEN